MATSQNVAGYGVPPNWHEYGPNRVEAELAAIAGGGREGFGSDHAAMLQNAARMSRQGDNAAYRADLLDTEKLRGDAGIRMAHEASIQAGVTGLLNYAEKNHMPLEPIMKILSGYGGMPNVDTSPLTADSDIARVENRGTAVQKFGEGVDKLRAGGVGTGASSLMGIINGTGNAPIQLGNVDPTSVEAQRVKTAGETKEVDNVQSQGYGSGGKEASAWKGPPGSFVRYAQANPGEAKARFPDTWNSLVAHGVLTDPTVKPGATPPLANAAQVQPQAAPTLAATVPPVTSSGANAANMPDDNNGTPGADKNITPETYKIYNDAVAHAGRLGDQLGLSQRQANGELLIPKQGKTGPGNIRIFKNPQKGGAWDYRSEPQ